MKSTQTQSIRSASPVGSGEFDAALILVLSCTRPLTRPARFSLGGVDEVLLGRGPERSLQRIDDGSRSLSVIREPDTWMSSSHARLLQSEEGWSVADAGSKNGTFGDDGRVMRAALHSGSFLRTGGSLWLFREHLDCEGADVLDLEAADTINGFTTLNPELAGHFASLRRLASTNLSVLLSGPTGTGKEIVANEIHNASGRTGPLVSVNCGAIPAGLVEATLLGSRKGAFSSATENRAGMVRASDGGTLFLDEIGELPLPAQTALLRVLQEREVVAVGSDTPTSVDLRVIAATNRDLEQMVREGSFREDLLARLAGHCVALPPLSARMEDLGLVCSRILSDLDQVDSQRIRLSAEAATALWNYHWPRNIRELAQALARAAALTQNGTIDLEHLPASLTTETELPSTKLTRQRLIQQLQIHGGNLSATARALKTSRSQLRRLLERHEIESHDFRA